MFFLSKRRLSTSSGWASKLGLVFDATYFYPEGGGQPSDRGTIAGCSVSEIRKRTISSCIVSPRLLKPGTSLRGMVIPCEIDREYRIHNMRIHTTCHLLFGAARKLFSDVKYAGFNIGEVGNLYLETPSQIRAEDLRAMSRLANEVVVENRSITSYFVDTDEARKMKDLAANMEFTEGKVRVIEVEGWDLAACSGTHMHNTLEIGPIKVVAREIHKKNVTRIDYAIGKRAVAEIGREEKDIGGNRRVPGFFERAGLPDRSKALDGASIVSKRYAQNAGTLGGLPAGGIKEERPGCQRDSAHHRQGG